MKAATNYADSHVQLGIANSRGTVGSTEPTPLHVSHFLGAFGLMFFGHAVALMLFVGELVAGSCRQKFDN